MSAKPVYISTSANRYSHCSSIAPDGLGLVAFGAGRGIALWDSLDPEAHLVHQVLPGHEAEVVSVQFLQQGGGDSGNLAFVSGDAAGKVILWQRLGQDGQFKRSACLPGHTSSVTSLCSLSSLSWIDTSSSSSSAEATLVLTAGSDCKVLVWLVQLGSSSSEPKLLQTISTKNKIPLALAISRFPGSEIPILALSCTDRKIQIFPFQSDSAQFAYSLSLEGHLDWVRALDFSPPGTSAPTTISSSDAPSSELLLASGSQDGYIRLWSLTPLSPAEEKNVKENEEGDGEAEGEGAELDDKMLEDFERKIGGGEDGQEGDVGQVSMKAFVLQVKAKDGSQSKFSLTLSALLQGHDTWVTSLHFSPPSQTISSSSPSSSKPKPLQLLSSSADNSMIIWSPTPPTPSSLSSPATAQSLSSSGIWFALHRFGQVSIKGLGFFAALWGGSAVSRGGEGREVLSSGWAGGWNVWREGKETDGSGEARWEAVQGPTGHFDDVKSVAWGGREGREWLISVSSDETTRIHAPWTRPSLSPSPSSSSSSAPSTTTTWAEIARPQVHGYPLTCLATLPPSQRFISGADEKVVRVFEETEGFVDSLSGLGAAVGVDDKEMAEKGKRQRPVGASVPPLGLSNKTLMTDAPEEDDPLVADVGFNYTHFSISSSMSTPPTENTLSTSTLWPELEKLYGHGYELIALTPSTSSHLIATSCKATTPQHAVVRLYSTKTFKPLPNPLPGHTLTVTRIAFSKDDRFVLTVGRDRGWRLFERDAAPVEGEGVKEGEEEGERGYSPVGGQGKPHARIIWDCSFSPLFRPAAAGDEEKEDMLFATASRDKTVKVWRRKDRSVSSEHWEAVKTIKFEDGVTSCDFYGGKVDGKLILAVGLETGPIQIFSAPVSDLSDWTSIVSLDSSAAHLQAVTRLAFQPPAGSDSKLLRLASGSDDRSVRVFEVDLSSV